MNSGAGFLGGMSFCITGDLPKKRKDIEKMLQDAGAVIASSVSKNVHYLLAGEDAGSKLDKAQSLGVQVIDWEKFLEMIEKNEPSENQRSDSSERMVFIQDDDSHWYLIPLKLKEKFNKMHEEANRTDDHDDFCNEFDEYRGPSPDSYSFTNPKEIE